MPWLVVCCRYYLGHFVLSSLMGRAFLLPMAPLLPLGASKDRWLPKASYAARSAVATKFSAARLALVTSVLVEGM